MFFINCALFISFKAYTALNGKNITYKNFLHKVVVSWIKDCEAKEQDCEAKENQPSELSEPTRRTCRFDHPRRLSNFRKHNL